MVYDSYILIFIYSPVCLSIIYIYPSVYIQRELKMRQNANNYVHILNLNITFFLQVNIWHRIGSQ